MSLKDRGWIDVQKRTWTRWTNMQLEKAKKGYQIEDVLTDFWHVPHYHGGVSTRIDVLRWLRRIY